MNAVFYCYRIIRYTQKVFFALLCGKHSNKLKSVLNNSTVASFPDLTGKPLYDALDDLRIAAGVIMIITVSLTCMSRILVEIIFCIKMMVTVLSHELLTVRS